MNLLSEADYIFKLASPSNLQRASATSPNLEFPGDEEENLLSAYWAMRLKNASIDSCLALQSCWVENIFYSALVASSVNISSYEEPDPEMESSPPSKFYYDCLDVAAALYFWIYLILYLGFTIWVA